MSWNILKILSRRIRNANINILWKLFWENFSVIRFKVKPQNRFNQKMLLNISIFPLNVVGIFYFWPSKASKYQLDRICSHKDENQSIFIAPKGDDSFRLCAQNEISEISEI